MMRNALWFAVVIGCFTLVIPCGCGPTIDPEQTASPQTDEAAKQHFDQQYQQQAEEMKKMQQKMRRKGR